MTPEELQAELEKIIRMEAGVEPVDLRYDFNKDNRVNIIDALALARGQATVPTVTTTPPKTIPPVTTTPPTTTATVTTTAPDAYQKQLDADALARGRERYVLEAEKILGRKLTPEEATALGQAAYPEIQRYTDPKTGAKSYMTPYYDVGSYFRDKLTDEDKQRLDRLIDSSVINAAQNKFPNLPLGIEEQERLKGLYGYEDALTYGGVNMPLDSQGNPKFLSALSASDLYNEIVYGVTARQAAENQAAADRAVYDAARLEGRAYNGTIYDTKEAAQKAFLVDAIAQGRVYNGIIYATKEGADYWKSIDDEFARIKEQERLASPAIQEAGEWWAGLKFTINSGEDPNILGEVLNYPQYQAYRDGKYWNKVIYNTKEEADQARQADINKARSEGRLLYGQYFFPTKEALEQAKTLSYEDPDSPAFVERTARLSKALSDAKINQKPWNQWTDYASKYGLTKDDAPEFVLPELQKIDPIIKDGKDITDWVLYDLSKIRNGFSSLGLRYEGLSNQFKEKIVANDIADTLNSYGIPKEKHADYIKRAWQEDTLDYATATGIYSEGNKPIFYSDVLDLKRELTTPTIYHNSSNSPLIVEWYTQNAVPLTRNELLQIPPQSEYTLQDGGHTFQGGSYSAAFAQYKDKLVEQARKKFGDIDQSTLVSIANELFNIGITDLDNVRAFSSEVDGEKKISLYDVTTGKRFRDLDPYSAYVSGFSKSGRLTTTYALVPQADGTFGTQVHQEKEPGEWVQFRDEFLKPAAMFALAVVPGINTAIGSAIGFTTPSIAQAAGSFVMNTAIQVASGVPIGDALKNAAIRVAVPEIIPDLTNSPFINKVIDSAATSIALGTPVETAVTNAAITIAANEISSKLDITNKLGLGSAGGKLITELAIGAMSGKPLEQILTQAAISTALSTTVDTIATENKLTPEEKAVLTVASNAAIQAARTGKINPYQLAMQLNTISGNKKESARVVASEAQNLPRSNTAIGAIAVDGKGELYTMDDDGNRMSLTGVDAGRVYTPDEWNSIQAALSAGQAQYVNGLINAMNSGSMNSEEVAEDLHLSGFNDATIAKIFDANEQYIYRSNQAQKLVTDYTAVGSDLSRESALERLRSLGFDEADATRYIDNIDRQVTARNDYANIARDYLSGVAPEQKLTEAMAAAGITGEAAANQLLYYRAIKEGDELTSSEATQAAVSGLRSWNVVDRKGTQVSWDVNEEGTPYVKAARDANGNDVTDKFLGATPQAIQKYAIEDQQRYVDRFQKQLTSAAEKYFAPGSTVTQDQAVDLLKKTEGMTDAMAKDIVGRWSEQKEAISKNNISIDPTTNKTSRILTPEEFERVLSKANVDISGDKFNQRYQAYLYVNGELLRTGNANDGFVLPGEVLEVVNKGAKITPLPTNTFIDEVGKAVSEGIKAGQSIGSPAQNFINSLSANFLGLFPRAGAGIVSVVSGDAANDVAVALRGIAKIASDSSDALMPDLASEANKWMGKISEAQGPGAKLGAAWQWASDSPTSFGSLAWTAGKELSEDMISFALMGKALKTIGTAPGVALGSAITDFALNYGGVTEENISQLINQGLSSEQAASLAGQGAMPAALAETIVGGIAALVPSAKTAIKDLISLPYKATVDGVEEAASYVFNQKGLGQSIDLNDFWTSGVIAATVGGAGHGGASLSVFLSPQGQGQAIKDASDLGLSISQDPFLIPETARATITSVIGNTAVMKGPSGQTYVADLGNQNITAGQQVNIYSLDTTPVQITPSEMKDYLSLVNQAYQGQLGRNPTADEVGFAIKDLSGVGQLQEKLNATQEGQRFDQLVETFKTTIGRNPTADEIKANITRLGNNEITLNQLKQELAKTNEGVLYEQKQIFNAQTDAQIAANAKSLLDQGKTTYADFKTFMNTMGLASDRQLNVLDTITPRANVSGTVTSIIGDNAVVTGTDGQMYTMLRVAPNNYLIQVGDQVNLGVSTVKPDATPTVEVTTKIADVIAASVSKATYEASVSKSAYDTSVSTSISQANHDTSVSKAAYDLSLSQSQSKAAVDASISTSISQKDYDNAVSVSVSQRDHDLSVSKSARDASISTSISQIDHDASISTSISKRDYDAAKAKAEYEASLSTSISLVARDKSVSTSISQADYDKAISQSISKANYDKELSISLSKAEYESSVSQSISKKNYEKELEDAKNSSISASISKAGYDSSVSTSISQLEHNKSISTSISKADHDLSISQSISKANSDLEISQSLSKKDYDAAVLKAQQDASISASVSKAAQDASISSSISKAAQDASISSSISKADYEASVSQSISRANYESSVSQSISKRNQDASISTSVSQANHDTSVSQSLSVSENDAKIAKQQSISTSISQAEYDAKIKKEASISASVSKNDYDISVSKAAVEASISSSISRNEVDLSISRALKDDLLNALSISASISKATEISISISKLISISQSTSTSQKDHDISISTSLNISQNEHDISISQSLSQNAFDVSVSQSLSQKQKDEEVKQSVFESVSITEAVTDPVTDQVTEPVTERVTEKVTDNVTVPPIVITTTEPPTTTTEPPTTTTEPPTTTTEPPTTPQVVTTTEPPTTTPQVVTTTEPPTTTPQVVTTTEPPTTTTEPPTTTQGVTTPKPVTTTVKPITTTAKPVTTPVTGSGLFPFFGLPAVSSQQTTYVDYAQPNVPAPEFGPYDLFKAPSYLRPLQDSGNFGLAALIGAASESQQRNGDNQSQQNAESQGQAPKG